MLLLLIHSLRDDDDEKKTEIIKTIHRRRRRRQTRRTRKRRDEQRRRRQLVHVLHVSVKSKIGRREEEEHNSVTKMQTRVPSRVLQTMARVETKRVGERDERDELAERVGGRK